MVAAAAAFCVLLQARPRDMGWIVLACGIAFTGARLGAQLVGPELGAFGRAARRAREQWLRPPLRPALGRARPGLLILVPGSIGFRSVFSLLENDAVSGVNAAFKMILVATSLVAGILLASIALPPKRAL